MNLLTQYFVGGMKRLLGHKKVESIVQLTMKKSEKTKKNKKKKKRKKINRLQKIENILRAKKWH